MGIKYNYFNNIDQVTKVATDKLNAVLKQVMGCDDKVLLLLSGGSALNLLANLEAGYLDSKVTIGALDERFDPANSNIAQIKQTNFYKKALNNGCQFIDSQIQNNETLTELAARMNSLLADWIASNPKGKIVATVGIGPDGHISGIMPFVGEQDRFQSSFVVGYDATGKNPIPLRVTTTFRFLKLIDKAIVYAIDKQQAVQNVLSEIGTLAETPARILREMPEVFLFTNVPLPKE